MKSAVLVFPGVRRSIVRILLLAAALTVAESGGVSAQPSASIQVQPIEVDGWRFKGASDLHVYLCDRPGCGPHSKVSFLLYPGSAIAPGQLRRQRELVGELLQERSAPCKFVDAATLGGAPRPMRCVAMAHDGSKSYDTAGIVNGSHSSASLISSSSDEAASEANYGQFEAALKAIVNSGPSKP
jgi:hypothetical protein